MTRDEALYICICHAMIERAIKDATGSHQARRKDALGWIKSDSMEWKRGAMTQVPFLVACENTGRSPAQVRQEIKRGYTAVKGPPKKDDDWLDAHNRPEEFLAGLEKNFPPEVVEKIWYGDRPLNRKTKAARDRRRAA